jgi:hypothetical protein
MLRARRYATTTVGALAILGCAGDAIVAPRPAVPITADTVKLSVTPHHEPVDTVALPTVVLASRPALTISPSRATTRATTRAVRYGREESLGFQSAVANDVCLSEGESTGQWHLRYSGYGCVTLTTGKGGTELSMEPARADGTAETHAPLLLGPEYGDRMIMNARVETVEQLRRNAEPNAWEVAWIVWQYQDDSHFYYFIPKPNGWELGKRDPTYPGRQRFLASSVERKFPLGHAYNVQITHQGNVFSVVVDGIAIVTFTDTERPYLSGRIALYSEDAAIRVHQVSVRTGAL